MSLKTMQADVAFTAAQRTLAGSPYASGPVANPGTARACILYVHCTAVSGTTPTLDVSLEESNDNVTYTAITGSGITQLTAAGNRIAYAAVNKQYVRATASVGGSASPTATFSADIAVLT